MRRYTYKPVCEPCEARVAMAGSIGDMTVTASPTALVDPSEGMPDGCPEVFADPVTVSTTVGALTTIQADPTGYSGVSLGTTYLTVDTPIDDPNLCSGSP